MLEVRDIRKSFSGFTAVGGVSLDGAGARHHRRDRPERRRQVDAVQSAHRPPARRRRQRRVRGPRHHRRGAARDLPHGRRPLVPAHQHLPQAHRVRERAGGADRAWRRRRAISGAAPQALYRDETHGAARLARPRRPGRTRSRDALSHGNQKQLELGIALASDPKLLLLDEPTAGMSAAETREAIRLLERIVAERKLTLLFTEHDMDVVFSIAQKIAVLHQGKLIAEGDAGARCAPNPRCGASISGGDIEPARSPRHPRLLRLARACCSASRSRWREGECVCLLGRNGVGKTTTMRAIMGLTPPTPGRIVWKGQDIAGLPPHRIARAGIGFVPEDRRIFAELTVRENLDVAARAAGRRAAGPSTRCSRCSRNCASWRTGRAGFSPAASSRCSPSAAR